MVLDIAAVLALAAQCAPHVAPGTLLAVTRAESGLDPLAIGVNGGGRRPGRARSAADAAQLAARLLATGANIDLGLGQINSANLTRLGLSVEAAFDPCRNLRASADVLAGAYAAQVRGPDDAQAALRRALSIYNTGDPARGFRNGYVARVEAAARPTAAVVPALGAPAEPPRPAWAVFGGPRATAFVTSPSRSIPGALP
jgi:type IV secretion system protein VirB1